MNLFQLNRAEACVAMKKNNIEITLDLNSGKSMQTVYFSDLSHEYVHINSAYTT